MIPASFPGEPLGLVRFVGAGLHVPSDRLTIAPNGEDLHTTQDPRRRIFPSRKNHRQRVA